METVTTENTKKRVNFLDSAKTYDWRYRTYQSLRKAIEPTKKTIYWIGTVELLGIRKHLKYYPIGCSWFRDRIQNDRYHKRDVDESPCSWQDTNYDLSEIVEELLQARDNGANYVHLLLEEEFTESGEHRVNILYDKNVITINNGSIGIALSRPWYLEPVKDWLYYGSQTISEETKRICILYNKPYNWQK